MENPNCDACGSAEFTPLYAQDEWFLVAPRPYRLVQCSRCGLIYQRPRPAPEEIGAYYQDDYSCYKADLKPEAFFLLKAMRRRKLAQRRKMIERYSRRKDGSHLQDGAILDVGCATGLFLHEMQSAGWETSGVEPSSSAARYAREHFGLNVHEGYLSDAHLPPESFDVITYWDVLEHTFSPREELAQAVGLLKKGGLLAINVPNYDSYEREWLGAYWLGLDPPRHLYVFTRQTLGRYLEEAGLTTLDWVCFIPAYFSTALSVEKWLEIKHPAYRRPVSAFLNFPGTRFLFEPWYWWSNRRRRSGIISVFAQKKG